MDRGAWLASPKGCRVRQDLLTKQTTKGDSPGGVINSCTILWLVDDEVTGKYQGLTSSVLRFQLVWGLPAYGHHAVNFFHLVGVLVSAEQLRNMHQTFLSTYFREELKILWLLHG